MSCRGLQTEVSLQGMDLSAEIYTAMADTS